MLLTSKKHELEIDEFIELAYAEGWTDGLPVFPPTDKRVAAMIDYLGRNANEIVGIVPPGQGIATIEKIAINAAMAGCQPEYMPVVVAALEAMLDPGFELLRVQATASGPAPLAIISGPVVKALNFNTGAGAFTGTGHRANAAIGRAIRLILWNIGYGRPGQMSQATLGHPGRQAYLIAERASDDHNPWNAFHVGEGLQAEDSAVSMFPGVTHTEISTSLGTQTLENSLFLITSAITGNLGTFRAASQKILILNPQAAKVLNDAGWDKARLIAYLTEHAVRTVRDVKRTGGLSDTYKGHWKTLADPTDDDALVPAVSGKNGLRVLVAGGWGSASSQCAFVTAAHGDMVTKKIDWKWDL